MSKKANLEKDLIENLYNQIKDLPEQEQIEIWEEVIGRVNEKVKDIQSIQFSRLVYKE